MRKTQITLLIVLLIPVLFFSCHKETGDKLDELQKFYYDNPESIAQVKFVHAYTPLTINGLTTATLTSGVPTAGTGFRITMDGNKISGANNTSSFTNTLAYGTTFPSTTTYTFLSPAAHTFKFIQNRIVSGAYAPTAADEVFSSTVALTAGKKYSMFIADPYGPPAAYMVEDIFVEPALNNYGVRFINLCADPAARFDVVSVKHGMKLFSNVGYKEMSNFIYLGTTASDTILLRTAGTNTVVSQINGFLPITQRVYTLYARGKTGVTGRTPNITFYTNR